MADQDYRIEPLNTLAFPKGRLPVCELTGLPARVQCITTHITLYYATEEHAEQAWHGIMAKIAPLLGPLRASAAIVGSEDDRAKREYTIQMSKRALIDLCQQEASKFLVAGRHELAVPGAIQALAFSKDIFGDGSVETVPPYLLLSEANLGLGKLRQAEEFLALANWSVLKNPGCSNAIRSQLHRNFGKLHTAQEQLPRALQELAKDVYCSAAEVGPEHVDTSAGYFLMANVFYKQRKIQNALAFYDKVVDIWYKFLASVRSNRGLVKNFGEAQLTEGLEMLGRILATRVNLLGDTHIAVGEAKYTLGLLHLFLGHRPEAGENLDAAAAVYRRHLGPNHPSTRDVLEVISQLQEASQQEEGLQEYGEHQQHGAPGLGGGGEGGGDYHPQQQGVFGGEGGGGVHLVGGAAAGGGGSLLDRFPEEMAPADRQSPIPEVPSAGFEEEEGGGNGEENG